MKAGDLITKDIHTGKYLKKHFPKVYRIITEKRFWLFINILISLFLIGYFSFFFAQIFSRWSETQQKYDEVHQGVLLWENIGATFTYPDAYFQAALFSYQIHDWKSALQDIHTVLLLNPTFQNAITLRKLVMLGIDQQEGR